MKDWTIEISNRIFFYLIIKIKYFLTLITI